MVHMKELIGIWRIGFCSEGIFICYAHFICAMNLNCIVDILQKCWAFSVALNIARYMSNILPSTSTIERNVLVIINDKKITT